MLPALTIIGDAVSLLGGYYIAVFGSNQSGAVYWSSIREVLKFENVFAGSVKPFIFGYLIACIAVGFLIVASALVMIYVSGVSRTAPASLYFRLLRQLSNLMWSDRVACPALVVTGQRDLMAPPKSAQA